jgi:hypothetical protein
LVVTVGGNSQLVLPDDMGDCKEGWQLDDSQQIVLCSATCDRVQKDNGATVRLLFGCAAGEIEIPK